MGVLSYFTQVVHAVEQYKTEHGGSLSGFTIDSSSISDSILSQVKEKYGDLITDATSSITTDGDSSSSGDGTTTTTSTSSSSSSSTKTTKVTGSKPTLSAIIGQTAVRATFKKNSNAKSYSVEFQVSNGEKLNGSLVWTSGGTATTETAYADYTYDSTAVKYIRARVTPEGKDSTSSTTYKGVAGSWSSKISVNTLAEADSKSSTNSTTCIDNIELDPDFNMTITLSKKNLNGFGYIAGRSFIEFDYDLRKTTGTWGSTMPASASYTHQSDGFAQAAGSYKQATPGSNSCQYTITDGVPIVRVNIKDLLGDSDLDLATDKASGYIIEFRFYVRAIWKNKTYKAFVTAWYNGNSSTWVKQIATENIEIDSTSCFIDDGATYRLLLVDNTSHSDNIWMYTSGYTLVPYYIFEDNTGQNDEEGEELSADSSSVSIDVTSGIFDKLNADGPFRYLYEYSIPTTRDVVSIGFKIKRESKESDVVSGVNAFEAEYTDLTPDTPVDKRIAVAIPPSLSAPSVSIRKMKLNISNTITQTSRITHVIYEITEDHSSTVLVTEPIPVETRYVSFSYDVTAGHTYTVRVRSYNENAELYSAWSEESSECMSKPVGIDSSTLTIEATSDTSVRLTWDAVETADSYNVQYCQDDKTYLDEASSATSSDSTSYEHVKYDNINTASIQLLSLDKGHEYFFRVCCVNNTAGQSEYSDIVSLIIGGSQPAAPTTWSNNTNIEVDDDVQLNWIHNSTDGSNQVYAELEYTVIGADNLTVSDFINPDNLSFPFNDDGTQNYGLPSMTFTLPAGEIPQGSTTSKLSVGQFYLDCRTGMVYRCEQINAHPVTNTDGTTSYVVTGEWTLHYSTALTKLSETPTAGQTTTLMFDYTTANPDVFSGHSIEDRSDQDIYLENDGRSYYILHTSQLNATQGCSINWRVRTKGIDPKMSEYSTMRTIKCYSRPTLSLRVAQDNNWFWNPLDFESGNIYTTEGTIGDVLDDNENKLTHYPLYISATTGSIDTSVQYPLSYNLKITALNDYEQLDQHGMIEYIRAGQVIFEDNYDIQKDLFKAIMPYDVEFSNDSSYQVDVSVSMSSGFSASASYTFGVDLGDIGYTPEILTNYSKDQSVMYLTPVCYYDSLEYEDVTIEKGRFNLWTGMDTPGYEYMALYPVPEGVGDYDIQVYNVLAEGEEDNEFKFVYSAYSNPTSVSTNILSCKPSYDNGYLKATFKTYIPIVDPTKMVIKDLTKADGETVVEDSEIKFEYFWAYLFTYGDDDDVHCLSMNTEKKTIQFPKGTSISEIRPTDSDEYWINSELREGTTNLLDNRNGVIFNTDSQVILGGIVEQDFTEGLDYISQITFYVRMIKDDVEYDWYKCGVLDIVDDAVVQKKYGNIFILAKNEPGVDLKIGRIDLNGKLAPDVQLSVYRREYDGDFTEVQTDISNTLKTIVDPHPSLDVARYRIVAQDINTYRISYSDPPGTEINDKNIIIQWDEEWTDFNNTDDVESSSDFYIKPYKSSTIKIPYNIDISDSYEVDSELIEYIGRKRPVSYYGTQRSHTSSWSVEIPKDDRDTVYALRRLAVYTGDVYVREPYGTGYWANIKVSMNQNHCSVTIPVTITITRVDGGV